VPLFSFRPQTSDVGETHSLIPGTVLGSFRSTDFISNIFCCFCLIFCLSVMVHSSTLVTAAGVYLLIRYVELHFVIW
jgi:hypothetical protein